MKQPHLRPTSLYPYSSNSSEETASHIHAPQEDFCTTKIGRFLAAMSAHFQANALDFPISAMEKELAKLFAKNMDCESARQNMSMAINKLLSEEDPWDPGTIES